MGTIVTALQSKTLGFPTPTVTYTLTSAALSSAAVSNDWMSTGTWTMKTYTDGTCTTADTAADVTGNIGATTCTDVTIGGSAIKLRVHQCSIGDYLSGNDGANCAAANTDSSNLMAGDCIQ